MTHATDQYIQSANRKGIFFSYLLNSVVYINM